MKRYGAGVNFYTILLNPSPDHVLEPKWGNIRMDKIISSVLPTMDHLMREFFGIDVDDVKNYAKRKNTHHPHCVLPEDKLFWKPWEFTMDKNLQQWLHTTTRFRLVQHATLFGNIQEWSKFDPRIKNVI